MRWLLAGALGAERHPDIATYCCHASSVVPRRFAVRAEMVADSPLVGISSVLFSDEVPRNIPQRLSPHYWRMANLVSALHKFTFLAYAALVRLRYRRPVIILERTSGSGDSVLCCVPAYLELKRANPESVLVFVTSTPDVPMLRASPGIDHVYGLPPGASIPVRKTAQLGCSVHVPRTSDELSRGGERLHLAHALFLRACGLPPLDRQPRAIDFR